MDSDYGGSDYYQGREGRNYFAWQAKHGPLDGMIESRKFSPHVSTSDTVVDFGCGGGYVLAALNCKSRIGVEINPCARDAAQANGIQCYGSLREIEDGCADVGISNHALEHVPYPIEAMRQLKSKVRSGGRVIICVPMEDWRSNRRYMPTNKNHHLYSWTPQLLGNALAEAGFNVRSKDIRILYHCWPPIIYPFLFRALPTFAFDLLCRITAYLRRDLQLLAVLET